MQRSLHRVCSAAYSFAGGGPLTPAADRYRFGDREHISLRMVPCTALSPSETHFADQDDERPNLRYALLRALHPDGYRDLRAIAPGAVPITSSITADDLAGVDAFAERHQDRNVFIGVAPRKDDKGRNTDACSSLNALFVDLDFKDSSEAECRARLAAFPQAPSAVIFSGGGIQTYWFLAEPLDVVRATAILRSLATALGADLKAAEPARILRLPGTLNHKYDPPRAVVVEAFSEWRYPLAEILAVLPAPTDFASAPSTTPTSPLPSAVAEGSRNDTLFREGCRLRRLRWSEAEITKSLAILNGARCHPPLDGAEVETIARSCARYEPAADTFPATESGDAEFFAACNADDVRFDHRRARWLIFNDRIWMPEADGEIARLALETMRARQRAAIGDRDRLKWATNGEARSRRDNLLALAKNMKPIADRGNSWDLDPWLLGTPNGVVDLRSGILRAGKSDDLITMQVRVPYDSRAICPLFEETVDAIFGGDLDLICYVQRALGYSLTGDCREEVFFLLWGAGANGKSTLIGVVTFVLQDYADDLPFSALERSRFGGGIPNDIAKLVGRRFVTASESNDVRLNEARIKALTGRDPITARFLHQEFFTFEPFAKFWLTTNTKPTVHDDSEGFWRRVHLIPFMQSFVGREDRSLKDKLRSEAPGILTWLVRGCLAWQREGLNPPCVVLEATRTYRSDSAPIARFIDECCVVEEHARATFGDLFAAYVKWCARSHEERLGRHGFSDALHARFQVDQKTTRHVMFVGVGLVDPLAPEVQF